MQSGISHWGGTRRIIVYIYTLTRRPPDRLLAVASQGIGVEELEGDAVRPAEALLYVVLAAAAEFPGLRSVVL